MIDRMTRWFGNGWMGIIELLITALCVFLSLSFHEFCHGFAAYKMGDNTAKNLGRLNMSPMSHIDPIGAICLFFFGFGWARPVPVNPRNFGQRKYKSGMVITSVAGPVSNLLLAFVSALLTGLMYFVFGDWELSVVGYNIITIVLKIFETLMIMNISLAIFNLIPIPPLDGSKILNAVLPARIYFKIMQYEQYGFIILLLIINLPPFRGLLNFLVGGVYGILQSLIMWIAML